MPRFKIGDKLKYTDEMNKYKLMDITLHKDAKRLVGKEITIISLKFDFMGYPIYQFAADKQCLYSIPQAIIDELAPN